MPPDELTETNPTLETPPAEIEPTTRPLTTFDELGLSETVLRAVREAGFVHATPIQREAIPVILQRRDVMGCAQTGTGKTASFTLPMIDLLASGRAKARMPRTLILEPTRELAAQVSENFETYGRYNKLTMALLIGGVSFGDQDRAIDRGADVLIATPGRLLDHFERGKLLLRGVEVLVIDEADRMLDMGFIPDVERIVQLIGPNRQTLFFSATMPPEIRRLGERFLRNPAEISVAPPASPAETVDQMLVPVNAGDKLEAMRRLLREQPVKNALVFCNRKRDVEVVYKSLRSHGFAAERLHGDMAQEVRTQTLQRFRDGDCNLMICSDVAARGLDIAGLSHVFLFDVPMHAEDYVHRIGRTGRAGMRGRAFTLAMPEDGKFLAAVESLIGRAIPRMAIEGLESPEIDAEGGRGRRVRGGTAARGRAKPEARDKAELKARAERRPRAEPAPKEEAEAQAVPVAAAEAEPEAAPKPRKPRRRRAEPATTESAPAPAPEEAAAPVPSGPVTALGGGEEHEDAPAVRHRERDDQDDRNRRGRGRRRDRDDDDRPVVGLGDHVPAFLLRPVKIAGRR